MYIYVNNFLIEENQPEQLKGLIAEIGKKAGIRTIIRNNFVSFSPPVSKYLVDLSFTSGLKSLGDSLKERLTISGFTTEPITKEQKVFYGRSLKKISVSIREGKMGIFWRGGFMQKRSAKLLRQVFDLKETEFGVFPLKGKAKKQIIIQGDKEILIGAEDAILEWFLLMAKTSADIPLLAEEIETSAKTAPKQKPVKPQDTLPQGQSFMPDPLNLLQQGSFGDGKMSEKRPSSSLDPDIAGLPLGDNIVDFLSSDDPKAKQLQQQIKDFIDSTGKKPIVPKEDQFTKAKLEEFMKAPKRNK